LRTLTSPGRRIEAEKVVKALLSTAKEVVMGSSRNLIIGAIVIVVLIAAYLLWRGNEDGPQSIPTSSTTESKK
jgi:hypothetical protein